MTRDSGGRLAPDLQPVLTGELVELRPVRPDDWPEMFAVAADPLIWAGHPVRSRYQKPIFRQFFDGAIESGAGFAILDRTTGRIIGSSRYHDYDPALGEIEIGWTFFARSHWGGIYNGEAKRLMLDHAFGFAEIVILWVGDTNLRSQRAIEKIGGKRREGLRDRAYHDGVAIPHFIYEVRRGA